jgi:hypothetical protein
MSSNERGEPSDVVRQKPSGLGDFPPFVRVTHIRAAGFSRLDAERLHRRAARRHGVYKLGRLAYVERFAVEEAIREARVNTT